MKRQAQDPGFGSQYFKRTKRLINRDGSFNVERSGVQQGWQSIYQELIEMGNARFLLLVTIAYFVINFAFACIYYFIGVQHLSGLITDSPWDAFAKCFFFSTQTFTTVGYGAIAPTGFLASGVAAVEAMCGLLSFALATGLLWGRFSRPNSRILFSNNAIIAPYKDGVSLQLRIANRRKNVLMEMQARMMLVTKREGDSFKRNYYELPLELQKVSFLPLSWTLVHYMDQDSPIHSWKEKDFLEKDAEIMITISGFDDTFNQVVHSRFSYTPEEIVHGAKFITAFSADEEGVINMNVNDIHQFERID